MTLGERLIQLRAKAGLNQDTLAEQLGVSRQSVSKWENDASVPDLEKLVKLSGVFGVSLDELVKGEVPDSAAPAVKGRRDGRGTSAPPATSFGSFVAAGICAAGRSQRRHMGNFICLASGDLRDSVSAVQVPSGPSLRLGRMAGTFCLRGCILIYLFEGTRIDNFMALTVIVPLGVLTVYSLRHPPSIPICWFLLVAVLYQYRNIWWLSLEPLGYLDLFHLFALPAGGKFLTLYWLAMLLLVAAYSLRTLISRRHRCKA